MDVPPSPLCAAKLTTYSGPGLPDQRGEIGNSRGQGQGQNAIARIIFAALKASLSALLLPFQYKGEQVS